jgi:hypothetical protein
MNESETTHETPPAVELVSNRWLAALAFSVWYANAWERDPYEHDEADIARMWEKFRDEWLPSLEQPHCGDCTNMPISCTRCHTEAYMKYAAIVARVTANK